MLQLQGIEGGRAGGRWWMVMVMSILERLKFQGEQMAVSGDDQFLLADGGFEWLKLQGKGGDRWWI
jgi:hypothetical protein